MQQASRTNDVFNAQASERLVRALPLVSLGRSASGPSSPDRELSQVSTVVKESQGSGHRFFHTGVHFCGQDEGKDHSAAHAMHGCGQFLSPPPSIFPCDTGLGMLACNASIVDAFQQSRVHTPGGRLFHGS